MSAVPGATTAIVAVVVVVCNKRTGDSAGSCICHNLDCLASHQHKGTRIFLNFH